MEVCGLWSVVCHPQLKLSYFVLTKTFLVDVSPHMRSILVLLESCPQTCVTYTIADCTANKLPMMDRRTVRNM